MASSPSFSLAQPKVALALPKILKSSTEKVVSTMKYKQSHWLLLQAYATVVQHYFVSTRKLHGVFGHTC